MLVVQDWGGPIGINYAVRNRANLRGLVVMNTWAWPASNLQKIFSIAMGGWPVGYWLQTRQNYFAKSMLPAGLPSEKSHGRLEKPTPSISDPGIKKTDLDFPDKFAKPVRGSLILNPDCRILLTCLHKSFGERTITGFSTGGDGKWQRYLKKHETRPRPWPTPRRFAVEDLDWVGGPIRRVFARTAQGK